MASVSSRNSSALLQLLRAPREESCHHFLTSQGVAWGREEKTGAFNYNGEGWGVGRTEAAESRPKLVPGKEKPARIYLGSVCHLDMGKSTPSCAVISLNNKHNWNKISWKFLRF